MIVVFVELNRLNHHLSIFNKVSLHTLILRLLFISYGYINHKKQQQYNM